MIKKLLFYLLISIPLSGSSQLSDNFSDGDFILNPSWVGDVSHFIVNSSSQLQVNSTGENASCLSTTCNFSDSLEWNFWIKLAFSPSDNNNAKVYLSSDQQDLKGSLHGYYLRFGEEGSGDAVELFKQNGTISTSICRGTNGLLANGFTIRIKVTYISSGTWKVFADALTGSGLIPEATGFDNSYTEGRWFGFVCKYTSSNCNKFYFDDISVKKIVPDITPPLLLSILPVTSNTLDVMFSEILDKVTAGNPSNYSVNMGVFQPAQAFPDISNAAVIHLVFQSEFSEDIDYNLTISNLKDLAGNVMQTSKTIFSYHKLKAWDVLIDEIMADPDPPIGLPNEEYLELYNRTSTDIDLSGWSLTIGGTKKIIQNARIPAEGFLIITDQTSVDQFSPSGYCVGLAGFILNNTGCEIILNNAKGQVIHTVSYLNSWYKSKSKANGGWSLEMIDPQNPCQEKNNWAESTDIKGGTPGKVNSVAAANPDKYISPVIHAGVPDPMRIILYFGEPMDSLTMVSADNYSVSSIGTPLAVELISPDYKAAKLLLPMPLQPAQTYTVLIKGKLTDCAGNMLPQNAEIKVALAELPEKDEIIINEVLFNPKVGGSDFVEIYNRSPKVLDLKDMFISHYDTLTSVISDESVICPESFLIFPGDYYVLTADTANIKRSYHTINPEGFIQMSDIPSMNDDGGSIALVDKSNKLVDWFAYNESMHLPLLTSVEGVSLEKMNPEEPSNNIKNWHSAAEAAGYATPAYKNSQYSEGGISGEDVFNLSPAIFSPDNDGHNDVLSISYSFPEPGNIASIRIYDATGFLVRTLVNNAQMGTSGSFSWDGFTDNRQKALIGRYIIWIEVFNLTGKVKHFKKTAVLGGKL